MVSAFASRLVSAGRFHFAWIVASTEVWSWTTSVVLPGLGVGEGTASHQPPGCEPPIREAAFLAQACMLLLLTMPGRLVRRRWSPPCGLRVLVEPP
jgi:hypothetical protein